MLAEDMIAGPFNFVKHRDSMQGLRNKSVSERFRIDPIFVGIFLLSFAMDAAIYRGAPRLAESGSAGVARHGRKHVGTDSP